MQHPLYSVINMNTFPGEMKLPGKTLKAQAENVGYQDIFRDIQQMRQDTYAKEVKEGEFTPEFSGVDIINTKNIVILLFVISIIAIWKS